MSRSAVGIDLGTFHTVAVEASLGQLSFPSRSVPSIAIEIGKTPIVGVDAMRQLDLPQPLMLAPKMKLRDPDSRTDLVQIVLRKLVDQSLQDLSPRSRRNAVLTVPPGWGRAECELIKDAVSLLDIETSFLHEPVAVLAAVRALALREECNSIAAGQLSAARRVLVCDWGAGTVDIALVEITAAKGRLEFRCIGEDTRLGHGGTDIALDVVRSVEPALLSSQLDKLAYQLQTAWQQKSGGPFDSETYARATSRRRDAAAKAIAESMVTLVQQSASGALGDLLLMLYGGPLESAELKQSLISEIQSSMSLDTDRILAVDSRFVAQFVSLPNIRRDCLVALGASLFGQSGETLPEFEYVVTLKDSFGKPASEVRLIRGKNLHGVQVVSPPFTGVDYFVDVSQVSNSGGVRRETSVRGELKLHVRKGAVILYKIAEAGVGFARIEASEAQDLPAPELFSDSRVESLLMPEKSTRFTVDL
jgi:hypothetical protein